VGDKLEAEVARKHVDILQNSFKRSDSLGRSGAQKAFNQSQMRLDISLCHHQRQVR
jgi:hypothetical protein